MTDVSCLLCNIQRWGYQTKIRESTPLSIPALRCSSETVVQCKCPQVHLMEVDMTIPSPEPSDSEKFESGLTSGMATESEHSRECHVAGEDVAMCQSSVLSEVCLSTVPLAPGNSDHTYSLRNVSATYLNPQQSEIDVAGDTGPLCVSIDDLPDEMLLKIFSHMCFSELTDVIQKVCSRWGRLAQDPELWADKEYYIKEYIKGVYCSCGTCSNNDIDGTTDQEAIQTFCDVPNLHIVKMGRAVKARVFRALYNNCHRLSELHLFPTQKLSYSIIKNLVEKCPRINTLAVSNELLKSEKMSKAVSRLEHLRLLELRSNYPQKNIPVLRPLGDGCPRLVEIIVYTTVDMNDLRYFLNAKRNTLKSIHINWTMPGRRCVLPLLLVCANSLECLELFNFDIAPGEASEAFTALGSLKNLRELKMSLTDLPPPSAAAQAFKYGGLPKLARLDLRNDFGECGLDDVTVIAISRGCPALQELIVRGVDRLSDAAFSQIYRLEHLEILDVSHCKGLGGALIPCLAGLPRLHTLWMESMEFPKLLPGLSSIVELSSLRCLRLDYSLVTGVPFDKFPGKLVSLRELHIVWCQGDPTVIDGLTGQMPGLEIYGSFADEPCYAARDDTDLAEEENAGPDDADDPRNGNGNDVDSGSESDNIWEASSISVLFPEDK